MQSTVTVKYIFDFTIKYIKYAYYGIKQRLRALFCLETSVFGFLKSLLRLPFECWFFTKMEIKNGY